MEAKIVFSWFIAPLLLLVLTAPFSRAGKIEMGGGQIDVAFSAQPSPELEARVQNWVTTAARAVISYYGRYPVPRATVRIRLVEGDQIGSGKTFGNRSGGLITVAVGRATTEAHFHSDWLMTHEMVHLAFPNLAERHHWLEEGLSTYLEPIARAQLGNLSTERVWSDLVRDLPQGLPGPDDRGLDFTPTWGRTYWGGALFCLLADVEIRRRTGNAKGLPEALRGILAAGGSISVDWDLERALRVGDSATGVPVLQELYDEMRSAPHPVDLDHLWQQLGIERQNRSVVLRDDAPLAAVRRAILPKN